MQIRMATVEELRGINAKTLRTQQTHRQPGRAIDGTMTELPATEDLDLPTIPARTTFPPLPAVVPFSFPASVKAMGMDLVAQLVLPEL